MEPAARIKNLPPYLFARIEAKIAEAKAAGRDIINLGIGDPDRPTPKYIIEALATAAADPANHQYPTSVGMLSFRRAVADWYRCRFGVSLDPQKEVVTLIGSKEGIAHLPFCYLNPEDVALVPDPGYPVYGIGTLLAGGKPYFLPLRKENGFLPDLTLVPSEIAQRAKLLFLNYPHNPTGAVAGKEFFAEVVRFAQEYEIIVAHDAAYSELTFDGYRAPSFLEAPGAKGVGIEFGSLSKPYNMTGWRIGWAVGNAEVIETLGCLKSNLDSGAFQAVQEAGRRALEGPQTCVVEMQKTYVARRDLVIAGLNELGWRLTPPRATFYVWAPVPQGYTSESFAESLLEKAGVVVTPGNGYGACGEGYFRIALTLEEERLREALARLKAAWGKFLF